MVKHDNGVLFDKMCNDLKKIALDVLIDSFGLPGDAAVDLACTKIMSVLTKEDVQIILRAFAVNILAEVAIDVIKK